MSTYAILVHLIDEMRMHRVKQLDRLRVVLASCQMQRSSTTKWKPKIINSRKNCFENFQMENQLAKKSTCDHDAAMRHATKAIAQLSCVHASMQCAVALNLRRRFR